MRCNDAKKINCAAVGFSDVTSANIVGFQQKANRRYLSDAICSFDQIGAKDGALDIQNLLPVDDDGEYVGDGAITIQFLSELGKATGGYSYYGKDEYDDDTPAGWYDEDEDELAKYTFGPAEGFTVYAGTACYLRFPEL